MSEVRIQALINSFKSAVENCALDLNVTPGVNGTEQRIIFQGTKLDNQNLEILKESRFLGIGGIPPTISYKITNQREIYPLTVDQYLELSNLFDSIYK
jgi:hypothetical protein